MCSSEMKVGLADESLVSLRRTATPYVGQTTIFIGITVFLSYVAHKTAQWDLLWAAAGIWAWWAIYIALFQLRYKILWNEAAVVMRASGSPERRIAFDEITDIRYEVAASESRPFRRFVVQGCSCAPTAFVDISLRHFNLDDIEGLMTAIRVRRPDLTVPTVRAILASVPY